MLEQNTPIESIDKKAITSTVKQLFDGDIEDLSTEFSIIDPIIFFKEVIKEKNKRGYHEKINIPCNYDIEQSELILLKIEECRKKITGEEFEDFWHCFDFNLDIVVWGSDEWAPRLLPNGAILIRNHHLVISLNEYVSDVIDIRFNELQQELLKIESFAKSILAKDDVTSFNIIHRDETGIDWNDSIPKELSEVGQSIVFIHKTLIEKLILNNISFNNNPGFLHKLLNISNDSRSGHCVLRVFRHKTFLYETQRIGDEFDTILENYSYYLGESPNNVDYEMKKISNNFYFVKQYIQDIIKKSTPCDLYKTKTLESNRMIRALILDKINEDYSSKKALQISSFEPVFGHYYDRPVSYFEANTEYWNFAQLHKGHMFLLNINYSFLPTNGGKPKKLAEFIKQVIGQTNNKLIKVHLPIEDLNYLSDDDVFDYDTPEYLARIKLILKKLSKKKHDTLTLEEVAHYESEETAEKEFLEMSGQEYKFSILFFLNKIPSISDCHEFGLKTSQQLDMSLTVHIPNYGFNQGYCSGELDNGNSSQFIPLQK